MLCGKQFGNCFGKRFKELIKKIIVILLFQLIGWFAYTYMEEGFSLTDCLFDKDNIRRLKTPKPVHTKEKLFNDLNETLEGELNGKIFNIYHEEFKRFFDAKEPKPKSLDVYEICTRWYLFTAITLTTVGYGNVVPKTTAGKIVFFPYCLIGIPIMLFFLGYIGNLIAELSSNIVVILHCRRDSNGQRIVKHKELKSFFVTFMLLWLFIFIEALASHYLPEKDERLTMVDGIYFYFVSFTTIGYGDITSPMNQHIFEFRLYLGLSLMSGVVNSALEFYQKFNQRRAERNQGRKKCCCSGQHHAGSVDIGPAEELVVVKEQYARKDSWVPKSDSKSLNNYGFIGDKREDNKAK